MDSEKRHSIWRMVGVGVVALLLLIALLWAKDQTPTSAPCLSIEYLFSDDAERMYLAEGELDDVLRKAQLYPVGKPMHEVALHPMEKSIVQHPMIRKAECFFTPRQEVRVVLSQREPLMRVTNENETYFIDTDRKKMPVRSSIQDSVLQVRGAIDEQMASGGLADFAFWLQDNQYWRERIIRLDVKSPHMIYIHMRGEQPRVVLGKLDGYRDKLAKLRTFYEQGEEATKDKHYSELDLRFKNQVVGRK